MYATDVDTEYARRLGDALRAALSYRSRETSDLAAHLGVDPETVRRWQRGDHGMSNAHAAAAAAYLNAPGDLFIRPPETWGEAMAMMGAWDELQARQSARQPGPSRP